MELSFLKNTSTAVQKQTNPNRDFLIEIVLLVLVCALFIWFIIMPKRSEISGKQATLEQLTAQEETVKSQSAKLKSLIKQLADNKDKEILLDKALPLAYNGPQLESLITNLANSVNVKVANLGLSGVSNTVDSGNKNLLSNPYSQPRTLQKVTGTVVVLGNFSQLQAFLQKLETSGRLMNITGLEMDSASNGNLNLRINLLTYIFGV